MARGEYKLATQAGGKAYFAVVDLDIVPDDKSGKVQLEFDPKRAVNWQTGARFGIEYVLEHIPRRKMFPNGIRIKVDSIQGHEVDTNNTVIAYAAALALLKALNLEESYKPDFDEEKGRFVFQR